MSATTNFNINGNVTNLTNSTGDHSSASSHYGFDSATLMSIIDPLNKAFSGLHPGAGRTQCLEQITILEAEAKKGKDADKSVIQSAFDTLKSAKDGIEGGEKIIDTLTKTYPFLAPFFGLPLLP